MEQLKKVVAVNTRMTADHDPVRTNLTIDATGLSVEDMFEYVIDSAVIKWQSAIRRKKDSVIPKEATYVVPRPGTRSVTTMSEEQMLEALVKKYGEAGALEKLQSMVAKNV
jgi:hypothetical protein